VKHRILIISQYFWPENFKINDIAKALIERGHEVSVLTGKPNYPDGRFYKNYSYFNKNFEIWNEIKIYRSFMTPRGQGKGLMLFLNYFTFAFFSSIRVFFIKNQFEKILIFEPSPITVGIPGIVSKMKFKAPIYFWVQDLWPESLTAAGGLKNKFILNFFSWVTRLIYLNSYKILVQSKAFIPFILNQNVPNEKLIYYPNSTESFYKKLEVDYNLLSSLPDGFKIIFAGNLGEAQSFDTILSAMDLLIKERINLHLIILGNGRMKNYIQFKIIELGIAKNVHLLGSFESNMMPAFFSCADALLVSLKKDLIFSLTIPSKIQSYLACGKPIIASLDGEGARIIKEANAGFVSNSEDVIGLKNAIIKLYSLSVEDQIELGENARLYFEQEFERERLIDKLELILS
jgi:glycosyltransferase involved in cell wall biosynthesis